MVSRSTSSRRSTPRSTWFVDRGVIHIEGAEPRRGAQATSRSWRGAWPGSIASDRRSARSLRRSPSTAPRTPARSTPSTGRSTPDRSSSSSRRPTACSVDHRHVGDPVDDALARLADPLVTELTAGHPERIKVCASDTCDWIFYDTSRTSRRRWCDMATCGNRAKAARHRARDRGGLRRDADAATHAETTSPTPYSL